MTTIKVVRPGPGPRIPEVDLHEDASRTRDLPIVTSWKQQSEKTKKSPKVTHEDGEVNI